MNKTLAGILGAAGVLVAGVSAQAATVRPAVIEAADTGATTGVEQVQYRPPYWHHHYYQRHFWHRRWYHHHHWYRR